MCRILSWDTDDRSPMVNAPSLCFILPHFYPDFHGGAEIQCYYLGQELMQRGWKIFYLHESSSPRVRKVDGIEVHSIPKRKAYLKWKNRIHLQRKMSEIQADFWYNRGTLAYLPDIVRSAKKVGGKVIFAFSRDSQFSYRDSWSYYQKLHMKLFLMGEMWRFRPFLKRVDFILTQTRHQQALLKQTYGLQGTQFYNAHPYPDSASKVAARRSLVLWIGRIKHYKHPEHFLELARALKAQPIECYLIGKLTDSPLSDTLIRQAETLPNLRLAGDLSSQEIHDLLGTAKALVCTSEGEGFSNTFIEAWLRGVPVFSLSIDPDNLIVQHGLGFLCPDLSELSEHLQVLLKRDQEWIQLSERCHHFAKKHFVINSAGDELENLLLGTGKNRG